MGTLVGLPMPQPGETITEGVVVKWMKDIGQDIAEMEPVVELETAKAVYEYESPLAGTLTKILTGPGEEQSVGQPLAIMECDESAAKKYLRLGVCIELDADGNPIIGEAKIGARGPATDNAAADTVATPTTAPTPATIAANKSDGTFYPPFIRTLAKQHNLSDAELANIPGTGLGGRLTKNDVEQFVARGANATSTTQHTDAPTQVARGGVKLPPAISGSQRTEPDAIRRRIADNMVLSKATIPHAGSAVEIDMTALMQWRRENKEAFAAQHGCPLRLAPCFLFAVREALKQFPVCNNFYFIDEAGKHWIEEHTFINLGIAVGTEHGLIVPVLKDAQDKDFATLAKESDALMQKALDRKLAPTDLEGATVTVNNPGALGSVRGNQVLPYPQSVIIGLQAILERPRFIDGQCVPRHVMEMSISFDHRLVDGVEAVGLISACKAVLESPQTHFTWS